MASNFPPDRLRESVFRRTVSPNTQQSERSIGKTSSSSFAPDTPCVRNTPHPQSSDLRAVSRSSVRQYAHSSASTSYSASTSTTRTGTRPPTASGRKSRATNVSTILGRSDSENVICAISEARGVSSSVGVAFVNVSLGDVTLCQICDNQSYVKTINKLQMITPSKVLFMSTACPPNRPSTLYSLVEDLIPDSQIDAFDRSAWSETAGVDYIQAFAFRDDIEPLKVAVHGKYYATSSLSAALRYIQQHLTITFAPHSLRIRYQPSDDTMMIDIAAFQSLEIMQNARNPKSRDCLFGLLRHTATPMGTRMLRSNILQPSTCRDSIIQYRYEALEELMNNEEMFLEVRKALKLFHDVEKLLTKLIIISTANDVNQMEEQINQVLMLKSFLEATPELYQALSPATSLLLTKVRDLCHPELTGPILDSIRHVIQADVTYMKSPLDLRNQRTFAVKPGINGLLDVSRQTYKELTEEIHQHVDEINDSSNEVMLRSDAVVADLIRTLRTRAAQLFSVCESVALVDMVSAFGQLATMRDYVKPEIGGTLALKAARHPILDNTVALSFVPNDYYASDQYCFQIVTGCNMSGKSTYIRTIALLQIMAQIGSFVPAEYAAFPIIHHIFARVSMDDSIESNLSTFSVEMREMAFILRNVDNRSLAVIDELGRGTSTRDGLAIAIAMSEALIQCRAYVWFATHFIELAKALADRPGVLNLHLAAKNSTTQDGLPQITMLYKVTSGTIDENEHYGINLARALGLSPAFIQKAEDVANDLRRKRAANQQGSESRKLLARRRTILSLHDALKQARDSGSEGALLGYLSRLQEEFIVRMEEVDGM